MQNLAMFCKPLALLTSGDSCQAALYGCLPAETAAIRFAVLAPPLFPRDAGLKQALRTIRRKQTRCVAQFRTPRISAQPQPVVFPGKIELPRRYSFW
jgi:hypothetical protein